jgi:PucR family transcriptional regulator, purine catabolism regulatory protein
MNIGLPSVHDVWRLALPTGAELLTPNGDLTQPVLWARRMAVQAPAFAVLEEDEIALISVGAIRLLDERLTLAKVVESLVARRVAALVVIGPVSVEAREVADQHKLCVLKLPDDADLRDVERDMVRLIVEREAQLDRRGRQIYRQLAQFSIENHGLQAIAQALQQIVQKPVIIQDEHLTILTQVLTDTCPLSPEALHTELVNREILHNWLSHEVLDSQSPPWTHLPLPKRPWARCVVAIIIEDQIGGYLSILGPSNKLDDLDRLAAERGALVCAVELAKQRAVVAAEQQLRGDFLDMLLTAGPTEESALARRAEEMGYPLVGQHVVVIFGLRSGDLAQPQRLTPNLPRAWSLTTREFRVCLLDTGIQVFLCTHEDKLVALCCAEHDDRLKAVIQYAQTTHERVTALSPEIRIAIGIGQPGANLAGLRRSFIQAREALALAEALFEGDKILTFGDLGLYHLLQHLQGCEELVTFYQQTLAPLVSYDLEHDAQLVSTLQAFFTHHGNVSQTAKSLYLHRNSLLYRLERIGEITEMDLDKADDRFALQLALKLQPLLVTRDKSD